jgi:hypothetical protein
VLNERTTHVHITPVPEIEMAEFMEVLNAVEKGFGVETVSLDSESGAWFTGTIKPSEIVTRWFDYAAFPYKWHGSIARIAVHQHSIASLLNWPYKTKVIIATADGINAKQFMEVLRAFQQGFGAEAESFDSLSGAHLLGETTTVTASRIVRGWSNTLSLDLSRRVEKIIVM